MAKRVGATSLKNVDAEILNQLNAGTMESATLSEGLAIHFATLLKHVAPELEDGVLQEVEKAQTLGITKRMALVASLLRNAYGDAAIPMTQAHPSDTVRGWATYLIASQPNVTFGAKLEAIVPLANDGHYSVREWAWLALREDVIAELDTAIELLQPWVASESANIRRFAIEVTRPRGVWSRHIPRLKASPELGRSLLEAVMDDGSKYVRDSCGNWLNDAAKSNPEWVRDFCKSWRMKSDTAQTAYIIKRGLRSIT